LDLLMVWYWGNWKVGLMDYLMETHSERMMAAMMGYLMVTGLDNPKAMQME